MSAKHQQQYTENIRRNSNMNDVICLNLH